MVEENPGTSKRPAKKAAKDPRVRSASLVRQEGTKGQPTGQARRQEDTKGQGDFQESSTPSEGQDGTCEGGGRSDTRAGCRQAPPSLHSGTEGTGEGGGRSDTRPGCRQAPPSLPSDLAVRGEPSEALQVPPEVTKGPVKDQGPGSLVGTGVQALVASPRPNHYEAAAHPLDEMQLQSGEVPGRGSTTPCLARGGSPERLSFGMPRVTGNEVVKRTEHNPPAESKATGIKFPALCAHAVVQSPEELSPQDELAGCSLDTAALQAKGNLPQEGSLLPAPQGQNRTVRKDLLTQSVYSIWQGLRPQADHVREDLIEALKPYLEGEISGDVFQKLAKGYTRLLKEVRQGKSKSQATRKVPSESLAERARKNRKGKVQSESLPVLDRKVLKESGEHSFSQASEEAQETPMEVQKVPGESASPDGEFEVATGRKRKPSLSLTPTNTRGRESKKVNSNPTPLGAKPSAPKGFKARATSITVTGPKGRPFNEVKGLLHKKAPAGGYQLDVHTKNSGMFTVIIKDPTAYKAITEGQRAGELGPHYKWRANISREERRSNYASSLNTHLRTVILLGVVHTKELEGEFQKAGIAVNAFKDILTKDHQGTNKCWVELRDVSVAQAIKTQGYVLLDGLKIRAQPYELGPRPKRCYRCQSFQHLAKDCKRDPKCSRCTEGHLTKQCPRFKKEWTTGQSTPEVIKCANCGGSHKTNADFCPTYLAEKRRQAWAKMAKGAKQTPAPTKKGAKKPMQGKTSPPTEVAKLTGVINQLRESMTVMKNEVRALKQTQNNHGSVPAQ